MMMPWHCVAETLFPLSSWYVQHTWHAELVAANYRKPAVDAEHVVCALHEKHDAVTEPESRSCSPGKSLTKIHAELEFTFGLSHN